MGLLKFFLARDQLGYKPALTYKGEESHNSYLGAALSVGIMILVLAQFV